MYILSKLHNWSNLNEKYDLTTRVVEWRYIKVHVCLAVCWSKVHKIMKTSWTIESQFNWVVTEQIRCQLVTDLSCCSTLIRRCYVYVYFKANLPLPTAEFLSNLCHPKVLQTRSPATSDSFFTATKILNGHVENGNKAVLETLIEQSEYIESSEGMLI